MNKKTKIITASALAAVSIGLIGYVMTIKSSDNDVPTFDDVVPQSTVTETDGDPLPDNWAELYSYNPSPEGITARTESLLRLNPDICGWIRIEGTMVDYPIVKDPGDVPEGDGYYGPDAVDANSFYLARDLDRSPLEQGTLFMDYRDNFGANEDDMSENILIYGHAMWSGAMFGSLRAYWQDYEFYKQSPIIELSSNYKDYDFVVFSFMITSGNYSEDEGAFNYWNMEELDDEKTFNEYIAQCRKRQMADTGVDVKFGDQLVTLSTCYSDEDNSRFILVGRRLREGEKADDMSTIQHTEEWKKAREAEETSRAAAEEASKAEASKAAAEAATAAQ